MTSLDGLNDDYRTVAFLGRDTLIANKRASGRRKDLDDVRRLDPPSGS